jgi:hypothetical protein
MNSAKDSGVFMRCSVFFTFFSAGLNPIFAAINRCTGGTLCHPRYKRLMSWSVDRPMMSKVHPVPFAMSA